MVASPKHSCYSSSSSLSSSLFKDSTPVKFRNAARPYFGAACTNIGGSSSSTKMSKTPPKNAEKVTNSWTLSGLTLPARCRQWRDCVTLDDTRKSLRKWNRKGATTCINERYPSLQLRSSYCNRRTANYLKIAKKRRKRVLKLDDYRRQYQGLIKKISVTRTTQCFSTPLLHSFPVRS